jgi:protein-disulfide isomerase
MMLRLDRAAKLSGVGLLALAFALLVRPSGAIGHVVRRERLEESRRKTIVENWQAFAGGAEHLGNDSSTSELIEFVSYTCPYCREFQSQLDRRQESGLKYSLAVRQLPQRLSKSSRMASRVALCAAEQGRFSETHRQLLKDTKWIAMDPEDAWRDVAHRVGLLSTELLERCLNSDRPDKQIAEDSVLASTLRMRVTPSFAHRSRGFKRGAIPIQELERWLASQASR